MTDADCPKVIDMMGNVVIVRKMWENQESFIQIDIMPANNWEHKTVENSGHNYVGEIRRKSAGSKGKLPSTVGEGP